MSTHYLIAPTGLKGSLSAPDTAQAIQDAIQARDPQAELTICPLADGGTDTLSVLAANVPLELLEVLVTGPLPNSSVLAQYGLMDEGCCAVIEAAQAHGLPLLQNNLAPMTSTSYGVGQLIQAIITQNSALSEIVVTLGGSASTDGGLGALQALGVRFTNHAGRPYFEIITGERLSDIAAIRLGELKFPERIRLTIATDVRNPLLGSEGTATIFAPQKGASPEQCEQLERELTRVSKIMASASGEAKAEKPGTGAAGGLGFGLLHIPHSKLVSGFDWLAAKLNLTEKLEKADVIITAEGCFDDTSLSGKVTGALIAATQKTVIVLCGQNRCTQDLPEHVQIVPFDLPIQAAIQDPKMAIQRALSFLLDNAPRQSLRVADNY